MSPASLCLRWSLGPLVALVAMLAPSVASAAACPSADTSYTGNCGPMFAVPSWTDAGGWNDPSQYSTIQLADVNGDGKDELIGRSDAGIQIYRFDTTLGEWRPQVDGKGVPQLLNDFASFLSSNESDPHNPNNPQYYSTIQAADIDGQPGAEILGRFWDGMRVYKYTPPNGGGIDGGSWSRIGTAGPFSDNAGWGDPSLYLTIQTAVLTYANPGVPSPATLFARQLSNPGEPSFAFYQWQNGAWSRVPDPTAQQGFISGFSPQECGEPKCTLNLQSATLSLFDPAGLPGHLANVVGRSQWGVSAFELNRAGGWTPIATSARGANRPGVFSDVPDGLDCPFADNGATGDGSGDCFGSSPSYYETLQAANIGASITGDELLGRASDGLRSWRWETPTNVSGQGAFEQLATLKALAGAPSALKPGQWGSIRTADLDGDRRKKVLFLDGKGLQAWSYNDLADSWSQLQPSTPLALGSDPWLSHPEYYSTIQTGDVDGDGRDDVIARGPYGIRTWFYNRRGTGGWERYLPEGYPGFADDEQENAFADLNTLAKQNAVIPQTATTVRDVWASENPPSPTDLTRLQGDLVRIGNCTGASTTEPTSYQVCTPPGNNTPERAAAWTAVINQMLVEIYYASNVLDFFNDLETMRESLFLDESSVLPAIGDDLGLQAAAGATGDFDGLALWGGGIGIAASIAGLAPVGGAEVSAALWIGSEIASMIPQSSPTATSQFQSTYAGLEAKFAQMVGEVDKGMDVQSQQVRQDAGLLGLVGQLRQSGAWKFDLVGLKSAANQGFAISAYQALMPTVYDRYQITGCTTHYNYVPAGGQFPAGFGEFDCDSAPDIPGVSYQSSGVFTSIGQSASPDHYPCFVVSGTGVCAYDRVPANSRQIWVPPSAECAYQPGKSQTAWHFGCSAGVDPFPSVAMNTWGFNSHIGWPDWPQAWSCGTRGMYSPCDAAAAAQARSQAPIRLGRARSGRRRAVRGRARLQAEVGTLRGVRLAGASVRVSRVLFERGHGELTHPRRAQRPLKLTLRRAAAGRFVAASKGRRRVRVAVQRGRDGRGSLTLTSGRVFHTPRACHALPASVARETPPLWLHSRLVIGDGRARVRVPLSHHLRCARDARGNVNRLTHVRYRRHPLRSGLALTVGGPRRVQPGTSVRYVARVRNRRRDGDRVVSSLWDVAVNGGTRTKEIRELRAGRTRTVTFTRRVPRTARGRFCARVGVSAPGARPAGARVCSRVQAARPPRSTG